MNILRRILVGYSVLIAMMIVVAAVSFGTLMYVSGRLDSQRAKQVQLATLTERVQGGFYNEVDSARLILLERVFNSPTRTDSNAISKPADASEQALQKLLPSAAAVARFKPFEAAATQFDTAHERVVALADQGKFRQAADAADEQLAPAAARVQEALAGLAGDRRQDDSRSEQPQHPEVGSWHPGRRRGRHRDRDRDHHGRQSVALSRPRSRRGRGTADLIERRDAGRRQPGGGRRRTDGHGRE